MLAHFYPGALTERICAGDQVAARSPQRIDLIHSAFAAPVVEVNRLWRFWRTPLRLSDRAVPRVARWTRAQKW
jgi:hypothetical protein